ncbi:MAG: adenosine deaminase [Ignavibacteriales bacterium]|nr:adenosine deaminase [Ignavibacteriales bacterium]MCB9260115.1 adenosine deaminase [Ignavibacteriales bacterium]
MNTNNLHQFIENMPKAELHLHIEGSFEPELMFKIADRNKIKIKYNSVEELKAAYQFNNLQEFLDIYYAGANVLQTEEDYYDLTMAYFYKINEQNVIHTEIMFDPQTHTDRGIEFLTVINGIKSAQDKAKEEFGITSKLIMSFLRHLDEDSAFKTLEQSLPFKNLIAAVGLDSSELGNPPSKFKNVFSQSIKLGFKTVAHAGEEGPAEYVWDALNNLSISRIDHGNKSLDDERLVNHLAEEKMPLTVCPLSNIKLCNVDKIENHPIKAMLNKGLVATVNSDDPAYFGGYMNENYLAVTEALNLTKEDVYQLTLNSFNASFLNEDEKSTLITKLDNYFESSK